MNSPDDKVVDRLKEVLGTEPELLKLLVRLSDLSNLFGSNLKLGQTLATILEFMRERGGVGRLPVLGVASESLLVKKVRFIGDKNGLDIDSSMTQACRLGHSVSQNIPSGVATALQFDTDVFDTDDMHDITVNNTRITFQTFGTYLVGGGAILPPGNEEIPEFTSGGGESFSGGFSSLASLGSIGQRRVRLMLNGIGAHMTDTRVSTDLTLDQGIPLSPMLYRASPGEYAEFEVFQDSGETLAVQRAGFRSPSFWAHRLS